MEQDGAIPFLNISAISQPDFNPGLELANPGIIEKVAPLCRIKESCGGDSRFGRLPGTLVQMRLLPRHRWMLDWKELKVLSAGGGADPLYCAAELAKRTWLT